MHWRLITLGVCVFCLAIIIIKICSILYLPCIQLCYISKDKTFLSNLILEDRPKDDRKGLQHSNNR
ncbi:unnamed protein product [Dracunculus medinensis]|uniref:Ovule protein n=1 Tax=Dracunculus medinensis TaxID=318479 RepID=A0A0N4U3Z5_DRAME|nr:unnamed protein product [Dracunculus medinensis]